MPLSAADTFPHPKPILVAGERFLEVMKRKSPPHRQSPPMCPSTKSLALQTCSNQLSRLSFAALAMRSMRVCRWLPLLFVCPRLSAGGCDIGRFMCQMWAAGPGRSRDCFPDGHSLSLSVSDRKAILTVCGRTVCLRSSPCCPPS